MQPTTSFEELNLKTELLRAVSELGYEVPSPIQQASIPVLLDGKDLLAQAQTGTGKTAAFALPILSTISVDKNYTQALVLAPTRELAIQVAQAFQSYAKHLPGFRVLPIYGGQDYRIQLKALQRGAHVVVGTPGRLMDHLRRETLSISKLRMIVLDEADEMLKMGFIDDVKWILQQIDTEHQTALFSATMPQQIKRISDQYLKNAEKIKIETKTQTAPTIEQFYTIVSRHHKVEALTRFLEAEEIDAMLIFARTKTGTVELADKLAALGYSAVAMNGDLNQRQRDKVIDQLKRSRVDVVVATDVAARGLDVSRISHVVNFDAPHDTESYVHRIGRTGRAGRQGKAFLFVSPRERRIIRDIERATSQSIKEIDPPSYSQINEKRTTNFTDKILSILAKADLDFYREYVEKLVHSSEHSELDIAAALVAMLNTIKPPKANADDRNFAEEPKRKGKPKGRGSYSDSGKPKRHSKGKSYDRYNDDSKPKRRYKDKFDGNNSDEDRPKRSFRGNSDGGEDKPKRTYRGNSDGGADRPKRTFKSDSEGGSDRPKRTFKGNSEGDSDRPKRAFKKKSGGKSEDKPRWSKQKRTEAKEALKKKKKKKKLVLPS